MNKVMLAANERIDLGKIIWPKLASPKIDGVRAVVQNGKCVAGRSLKDSLNRFVTAHLSNPLYEGLDGELTVEGKGWNDFNTNQSAIMSQSSMPKFIFWVFDDISLAHLPASVRKQRVKERVADLPNTVCCVQRLVKSAEEALDMYNEVRTQGYEGLILCDPSAKYKHGRSTLKQEIMVKLKPAEDSEGVIIYCKELLHNLDAGNTNKQENMVPGGMLGAFVVQWGEHKFSLGSGFTKAQQVDFWNRRSELLGKLVKFKFMEVTAYGKPRHPVFLGFRSKDDL